MAEAGRPAPGAAPSMVASQTAPGRRRRPFNADATNFGRQAMKLFDPLKLGGMTIPNRIMVPAMVTHLCKEDGIVTQDTIDRYVRYAAGGAGLIVVEAMAIHQVKSGPLLRISDDTYIPGLRELAKRVHGTSDSKIVPQII